MLDSELVSVARTRAAADEAERSGPSCRMCGHPFGAHGDRAVVACATPTLSPRYTVVFCNCTGWVCA
jgi:hypothetical protein